MVRGFLCNESGSACLRTALAVGATALLPALGWQAGEAQHPAIAAPAIQIAAPAVTAVVQATVVGKQGITWTHAKADRAPLHVAGRLDAGIIAPPGQPETVVEVIDLAAAEPQPDDGEAVGLDQGSADPLEREAERALFADWLAFDETFGAVRITGFGTRRDLSGKKACREQHDTIVKAFHVSPASTRIMADQPVMFQSRICAANGEIVITCHGSEAVVSPRRARPGSSCARS
jgi:hypothetical protein